MNNHNTQDAVSLITTLDPNLHGMEAVVGTIVNNTAVYTALGRRYREGGRPGLADALDAFVEAHGELLRGIRAEALSDELARSFEEAPSPVMGEDGYFRAPLPPLLELTQEEIDEARVSVRDILGCRLGQQPSRVGRTRVCFVDGTVGVFRGAKALIEGMLAAREGAYHN